MSRNTFKLLCLLAIAVGSTSCAAHTAFAPYVAGHAEEALTWCGPATAKMVMAGYPTTPCSKEQYEAWAEIDLNRVEAVWDTDPAGMEAAVENLCAPPGGGWSIVSNANASSLMFSVAYWMTVNQYPVAALLSTQAHNAYAAHEEHWVMIRGVGTDADPTTTSSVNLEFVWFVDPGVPLGDPPMERLVTAATWYSEFQQVTKATSTYNGKFVVVLEPPERQGRATLRRIPPSSGEPMLPAKARQAARRWVRHGDLQRFETFKALPGAESMEPFLVGRDKGAYYLVPFRLGSGDAEFAVLLDARSGRLLEIGSFAATRFLSKAEALQLAGDLDGKFEVELVADASAYGSRYRPAWKITGDGVSVAVPPDGVVRRLTKRLAAGDELR